MHCRGDGTDFPNLLQILQADNLPDVLVELSLSDNGRQQLRRPMRTGSVQCLACNGG